MKKLIFILFLFCCKNMIATEIDFAVNGNVLSKYRVIFIFNETLIIKDFNSAIINWNFSENSDQLESIVLINDSFVFCHPRIPDYFYKTKRVRFSFWIEKEFFKTFFYYELSFPGYSEVVVSGFRNRHKTKREINLMLKKWGCAPIRKSKFSS